MRGRGAEFETVLALLDGCWPSPSRALRRWPGSTAWVLRLDNICAIPRSGQPEHVYENRTALAIHLDRDALAALDAEFPPPLHAQPLEVL